MSAIAIERKAVQKEKTIGDLDRVEVGRVGEDAGEVGEADEPGREAEGVLAEQRLVQGLDRRPVEEDQADRELGGDQQIGQQAVREGGPHRSGRLRPARPPSGPRGARRPRRARGPRSAGAWRSAPLGLPPPERPFRPGVFLPACWRDPGSCPPGFRRMKSQRCATAPAGVRRRRGNGDAGAGGAGRRRRRIARGRSTRRFRQPAGRPRGRRRRAAGGRRGARAAAPSCRAPG